MGWALFSREIPKLRVLRSRPDLAQQESVWGDTAGCAPTSSSQVSAGALPPSAHLSQLPPGLGPCLGGGAGASAPPTQSTGHLEGGPGLTFPRVKATQPHGLMVCSRLQCWGPRSSCQNPQVREEQRGWWICDLDLLLSLMPISTASQGVGARPQTA